MKKITALFSTLFFLMTPAVAFAQDTLDLCPDPAQGNEEFNALCRITTGSFGGIIGTVIIVLFIIAIIIALLWLVIGGIKWITSGGDSAKVEGARNQIIAAVIGLVVVFLSFFILNFVLQVFGFEDGINSIEVPTIPTIAPDNE